MKTLLLLTLLSSLLFATEYAVVANKEVPKLSKNDIKAIYLKRFSSLEHKKIVPLNLGSRNKIRKSFQKHVLGMSFMRLKAYWTKQHYLGHRPPISMKSQEGVVRFVQKVDMSIGYTTIDKIDTNLKILYRWSD